MYSKRIEEALAAKHISAGDRIKLTNEEEALEGVLMPRPEAGSNEIIILKLDNGYNIGIKFTAGSTVQRLGTRKESFTFPKASFTRSSALKNVHMLYTGGTIGSKVDYVTGGVYMLTKPEELMAEVPELAKIANLEMEHLMSVSSEDISYLDWQKMAEHAAAAFNNNAAGVVITHGTDTMHYTAAALSFMLKDLKGPVAITGAQRSSDRGSSDAFMNLICSMHVAASSDIGEVGICMHATSSDDFCHFLRGTKVRKMHTTTRHAFKPINSAPIAKVSQDGKITYESMYAPAKKSGYTKALTGFEPKVALVATYPNSDPGILDYYVKKGYKGIILSGTGMGHAPVSTDHAHYNWLHAIKDAAASGLVMGMTSQCMFGRVNPNVYRNGRLINDLGVVYCEDMLPEVAYVKLGFLLGNYKKKDAEALLAKNIAGEITERTEAEWAGE